MKEKTKVVKVKEKTKKFYYGVGRRKTSTATVYLYDNRGPLIVNDKPIEEYFPGEKAANFYLEPFRAGVLMDKFRGTIKVRGGGKNGQLGAVLLGIARALEAYNPELRVALRKRGLLTRDPRMKERKKYNLHKARRAHQYSKR